MCAADGRHDQVLGHEPQRPAPVASILKVMNLYARFSRRMANSALHLSVGRTPDILSFCLFCSAPRTVPSGADLKREKETAIVPKYPRNDDVSTSFSAGELQAEIKSAWERAGVLQKRYQEAQGQCIRRGESCFRGIAANSPARHSCIDLGLRRY